MYVLGKTWCNGYLDYHLSAGLVRVRVSAWWVLEQLRDVTWEQPRNLRRVWNYVREVGVAAVIRKIRSRRAEWLKNRRVLAVGLGEVIEGGDASGYPNGCPVVFVALCHPECVERVVLPPELLAKIPKDLFERFHHPGGIHLFSEAVPEAHADWTDVAGWSRFSGTPVSDSAQAILEWARREFEKFDAISARMLSLAQATPVNERTVRPGSSTGGLTAVLFGLGNYAKTCVLPNLDADMRLTCIHEVDPTQIGRLDDRQTVAHDTAEFIRPEEKYDVYLIAGYHHTHADLAVHALRSGSWAVIEKPVVTTREQLASLLSAMEEHPGRVFAGFHMRYSPLWELARQDLGVPVGEPIHYHCIVYEVPLVRRHWYNWPNSRSRVVSNGCHWLDHFLYMNGFSAPARYDLWRGGNGDLHASVELENGAVFGMHLTDIGSRRIGVQDHIELRANGVTVRVQNTGRYSSEDEHRIIRKKRINKASLHRIMYGTISRRILRGEPGDSVESVRSSCELMLALEKLHEQTDE